MLRILAVTFVLSSTTRPLDRRPHARGQSGRGIGTRRQVKEGAHGGDLMPILLHAPVESTAVFRANQCLRRTDTLGNVRHVETMPVYRVVEMLTALLLYAKP